MSSRTGRIVAGGLLAVSAGLILLVAVNYQWFVERRPLVAASIATVLVLLAAGASFGLVGPNRAWSLARSDIRALVVGAALTAGSLGCGAAYLGELSIADIGTPPELRLSAEDARLEHSKHAGTSLPDTSASREHAITLSVAVQECDKPVLLTVAYWPPRGARLSGRFSWEVAPNRQGGPSFKGEAGSESNRDRFPALIADPEDGGHGIAGDDRALFPPKAPPEPPRRIRSVPAGKPMTRDRPYVAVFEADWLVRRNTRSCFLRLPPMQGLFGLTRPDGSQTSIEVSRYVQTVVTSPEVRAVPGESDPEPRTSSTGQPSWVCSRKAHEGCVFATAVFQRGDAEARLNLTLLVLGALISLGLTIVIQVALRKVGVNPAD